MSFELYRQISSCSHPSPNNRKSYVRPPSVLCVGRRSHFDVSPLSLSLAPAAHPASSVTYLYLTKDSSQNSKARLVGWPDTDGRRHRDGEHWNHSPQHEIWNLPRWLRFWFEAVIPLFFNLHNASLAKDGFDTNWKWRDHWLQGDHCDHAPRLGWLRFGEFPSSWAIYASSYCWSRMVEHLKYHSTRPRWQVCDH